MTNKSQITLIDFDEIMLKNDIFEFKEKTFKQLCGTLIRTKFAPPYATLFMADLGGKILNFFEGKPMIRWRYVDNMFFIWKHE